MGYLHRIVEVCHSHAFDINHLAMSFGGHLFSLATDSLVCVSIMMKLHLLVIRDIVVLHVTPVSPSEPNLRRRAIDLKYLPSKGRHHPLERLVAHRDVVVLWTIVLVGSEDRIVRSLLEHIVGLQWRRTIHGKRILILVDGSPVLKPRLERCFNLPILDQVLHKFLE